MDFNLNEYTIILLAINLASSLIGNAYYFLRQRNKKSPPPPPPPTPSGELHLPAPFASPEFVTEILERV